MTIEFEIGGKARLDVAVDLTALAAAPAPFGVLHIRGMIIIQRYFFGRPGCEQLRVNVAEIDRNGVTVYLHAWVREGRLLLAALAEIIGQKINPADFWVVRCFFHHQAFEVENALLHELVPPRFPEFEVVREAVEAPEPQGMQLRTANARIEFLPWGTFYFNVVKPSGPVDHVIEYWTRESRAIRQKVKDVLQEIAAGN
jgi:hypothetical protein